MRMTITIDDALYRKVKQLTPNRGITKFINEALSKTVQQLEREKIESLMKEGYLETRSDRAELNSDWQVVELEGWSE